MSKPDIIFYHHGKAHLPGIYAYTSYFSTLGIKCEVVFRETGFVPYGRIHWKHMGIVREKPPSGCVVVHEYTSTSVPPFARLKDFIKRSRNSTPDARVFQNKFVQKAYSYSDNVPFFFRPVACADIFFKVPYKRDNCKYDFVYCGTLDRKRHIDRILINLINQLPARSFLIVGAPSKDLSSILKSFPNVSISGKIPIENVPSLIASARYGLNLVPDKYPYNLLISTKLLEYSAVGLPVLTLGGKWLESFEKENGARFFHIGRDSLADFDKFSFIVPDVNAYRPGRLIEKSGITEWVKSKL